jgi:hypothetical protein
MVHATSSVASLCVAWKRIRTISSASVLRRCRLASTSQLVLNWLLSGTVTNSRTLCQSQNKSCFTTGGLPPIGSSWRQAPRDPRPVFLVKWTFTVIVLMWHPLWREDGSVIYNCCWSWQAKSFSGPSPSGLKTEFYCLRFETSPTWRARSPYLYLPGNGWPSYTPRLWVPFSSPPTIRRTMVEVFEPAPHGVVKVSACLLI